MEKQNLIAHTISSIDTSTGGPARSVTHLVSAMAHAELNLSLKLHTGASDDPIISGFDTENASLQFYRYNRFGGLKHFKKNLNADLPQLCHGHGLWQMPVKQMASFARSAQIPYIITPRGMLEPWSLSQGKVKKQLALKLYQSKDLSQAACIHATAKMEADNIRALGFQNPIAVIPNGIPLEEFPIKAHAVNEGPKTLLFLSRVHPKKGIELLIDAWAALPEALRTDWQVQIAGNGEPSYVEQLINSIASKGLAEQMKLVGPLEGAAKLKAYQQAQAFVLPTYSENFGIVVAEALACGTPVITTHGTPWEALERRNCGWWIPIGVTALKQTLESVLTLPESTLVQMGNNGRQLIEDTYSMTAVAQQMLQLYRWILRDAERPEFVSLP